MALPDYISQTITTSVATGIANVAITNNMNYLGAAIPNFVNLHSVADILIKSQYQTAPTVGDWRISFCYDPLGSGAYEAGAGDGSNGANDVDPALTALVAAVSAVSVTAGTSGANGVLFKGIPLRPYNFKILVQNVDQRVTAGTFTLLFWGGRDAQISDT